MQSEAEAQSPPCRQWHVVSRYLHFLEATASLEFREGAAAPMQIHEVSELSLFAELDCFGDQNVIDRFVPVLDLRDDLTSHRVPAGISEHGEADQFVAIVRSDEILSE